MTRWRYSTGYVFIGGALGSGARRLYATARFSARKKLKML